MTNERLIPVDDALAVADAKRYLQHSGLKYDVEVHLALWSLANEVHRLRARHTHEPFEQRHTLDCDMVKHPNCTRCNCGSSVDPDSLEHVRQSPLGIVPAIGAPTAPAAPGASRDASSGPK